VSTSLQQNTLSKHFLLRTEAQVVTILIYIRDATGIAPVLPEVSRDFRWFLQTHNKQQQTPWLESAGENYTDRTTAACWRS
jgi:hypothetical protein